MTHQLIMISGLMRSAHMMNPYEDFKSVIKAREDLSHSRGINYYYYIYISSYNMASSYEDDDIKVAFEFRIVDSRGAVILWSSSIIAPDGYFTIGDAIQHQDDIQVNARDRFMQYWRLRDEDDSGTRVG